MINDLERKMPNGKLVLMRDDGKPLRPKFDDLVNANNDNEVDEVFNETASFIASTSFKVNKSFKSGNDVIIKSLYETWKETYNEDPYDDDDFDDCGLTHAQTKFANETYNKDPYDDDDFDDCGLTHAQTKFANAFDISLRGQLR
ncbi:hypothetical protein Tco_1105341 [Tanacetum coccineum]